MNAAELSAAIETEQREREQSFLAFPETVAGFELRPMTLRDMLLLMQLGNVYLAGMPATMAVEDRLKKYALDSSSLIWLQSVTYKAHDKQAKRKIESALGDPACDLGNLTDGIYDYVKRAFYDQPASPVRDTQSKSYWSIGASLVHAMGKTYGWTREQTLSEPLRVLWQLLKVQHYSNDPKAPQFNPSDQIIAASLKARKEAANAQ